MASTVDYTQSILTGDQYLESLRDGREVWLNGARVEDVTVHPAFRNAARSIARLYEEMQDAAKADLYLAEDSDGLLTHRFFKPSYSSDDLLKAREAIAEWARMSYGYMGRTPDYKAAFMAALGANPDWYAPFGDSARAWYRRYAQQVLFVNHVFINPPIDRNKATYEVGDVYLHVVEERDGGAVVRGAKMLGTGSALTHATFVMQTSTRAKQYNAQRDPDYDMVFMVPMNTPGLKIISRASYEAKATSPFDSPLSSRFDENDAVLVFDHVFVPWEDFLIYRDPEKVDGHYPQSGFMPRYTLQSGTRLAIKLDFLCGLFVKGLKANGTDSFRGVQAAIGELQGWRNLIWAVTTAMCHETQPGPGGSVTPTMENGVLIRLFGSQAFAHARKLFTEHLGGAPLVAPASNLDLLSEELRPVLDTYYRGTDSVAEERIKLFKLIWDAMGSEFAGRHGWYEVNYAGNQDQIRIDAMRFAQAQGIEKSQEEFVEQCMADYDLNGWTSDIWAS